MTDIQFIILVIVLALSVQITRVLPFIVFRDGKKMPPFVGYLGKVLPAAMMGLLVIYSFKDYDYSSVSSYLPAFIAGLTVAGLQLWKRNTILSIAGGTVLYMILLHFV